MSSIGAITSGGTQQKGFSSLSAEDFMGIILKELSNQDPLQPSETKDLLEQLATIRSIQSNADLVERLGTLVGDNQWASASGLLGRQVSGLTDRGERVTDRVVGIIRTREGPVLSLDGGQQVRLGRVDQMVEPPPAKQES